MDATIEKKLLLVPGRCRQLRSAVQDCRLVFPAAAAHRCRLTSNKQRKERSRTMPVLNFSPLTAIAVGPAGPPSKLSVSPHSGPSTAIVITAGGEVKETDFQWVELGLTVASGTRITGVVVCYQVLGGQGSYISQVRLSEMTTPNTALVKHDDGTNLTSTAPVCYKSNVKGYNVNGTVTLELKIVIGRRGDKIIIGSIALESS